MKRAAPRSGARWPLRRRRRRRPPCRLIPSTRPYGLLAGGGLRSDHLWPCEPRGRRTTRPATRRPREGHAGRATSSTSTCCSPDQAPATCWHNCTSRAPRADLERLECGLRMRHLARPAIESPPGAEQSAGEWRRAPEPARRQATCAD